MSPLSLNREFEFYPAFVSPAEHYRNVKTSWNLVRNFIFDRTPIGEKEWDKFKKEIKLRDVNRPLLALKAAVGIDAVD
jgi:hypothetical protein